MLYYVMNGFFVLSCLLLLLVILLQQGKGGDMASAFGGSGSQTAFGARGGATVLTRATVVLGTLFMVLALGLAIIGRRGPGSVVSGLGGPAVPVETVTPAGSEPGQADATAAEDADTPEGSEAPSEGTPAATGDTTTPAGAGEAEAESTPPAEAPPQAA